MTAEQVEYVTNIDQYIESNNLRQLFFNLTSQLTKAQPDDPIQYLIDHLQNKTHLRFIYVNGIVRNDTVSLANSLSVKFNYSLIDMFTQMNTEDINSIDNDKINRKVIEQIKKIGKNVKGAIICGYPNNHIQGQFIQKNGYFPERLFVFPTDQLIMEKYYINQGITPNKAKLLNVRNIMNVNEVKALFEKVIDILPESIDASKTIATNILKIKDISPYPLDSPKILIIHPPYIQLPAIKHLCSEFGFYFISVESAFLRFKSQKNTFRQYVRNFKSFTTQIELGIVRTQCTSVVAKKKGFVLSGWPNSSNKLTFLDQHYLRPHIIFAFCGEKQQLEKIFNKTDTNNSQIFPLKPKPTIEQFRQELDEYNKFLIEVKKNTKTQVLTVDISQKDFIRAFENKISNKEIYK